MFERRTWAIALTAALLAGSAVAIASGVQGQDFEREGQLDATGSAYEIEWDSEDPGKLRLSLDPDDGATNPRALVSLIGPDGDRIGSYELTEQWPRLDQRVEAQSTYKVIVHRALDSEVDVLAEEGHPVSLERIELSTERVPLVDGDDEAIRTRVSLDREAAPVHLGLSLEGQAEDLQITALNEDDEPVLEASAQAINTSAGERLVGTLHPEALRAGSILVQIQADALDGSLGLRVAEISEGSPNVVEAHSSSSGQDTNTSTSSGNETTSSGDGNATDSAEQIPLTRVAKLEPGTPVAVSVPEGVEALHVVAEEDCGEAVVFGPQDNVVGQAPLASEEGAEAWNGSDDDSHEDRVVASIPVNATGKHVVVLANAWEEGALYMRVQEPVDHRELNITEVEGQTEGDGDLFGSSNGSSEDAIDGGLLGFSWESQGADLHREVELTGPSGETLYHAEGMGAGSATVMYDHNGTHPLVGPSGNYTVTTEGQSATGEGISYTLYAYQR